MPDFTTVMTTATSVDNSIILAYEKAFLVACGQEQNLDQLATVKRVVGAKSIQFPKYSRLAVATTPLVETEDVASVALADAEVKFEPAEYGNVVTRTALASIQSGGVADLAAATVVGINMGMTMDALAIAALDGATKVTINDTAKASIASNEIASRAFINRMYNKLARASVPKINGMYVMVAHDDVINDLRNDTAAGSWVDVSKYSDPATVLANEVGSISGFRVIRNNQATIEADAGSGNVDVYNSYFLGFNALGKAISSDGKMVFSGPFDKLSRFVNVGWHAVVKYGLIDTAAAFVGQTAASVGANT